MATVETISIEEAEAAGLPSIVHAGSVDSDNQAVEALWQGNAPSQQDRDGRQIISYKQYQALKERDARMDNYAMRMTWPGSRRVQTIQASKFLKWWGYGYIPIGITKQDVAKMSNDAKQRFKEAGMLENVKISDDGGKLEQIETVIFRCATKHPECLRFFDSQKGLDFHWKRDHKDDGGL